MDLLNTTILENSVEEWLVALAITIIAFVLFALVKRVVHSRLTKTAPHTETHLDDDIVTMLDHTKKLFLAILAIYIGARYLTLTPKTELTITSITVIAIFIQGGIWGGVVFTEILERYRTQKLQEDPAGTTTLNAVGFIGKLVLWSLILLLILDNLGINITTLIAGLGVGGIAVALAVQNVLGDLLAALAIVLDKPFAVGDFLIVDDYLGSVEYVGLKTTRMRSLSGEQLIFSNSDLLKSRLRNYGRMFERRVVFTIGVTYQTPREKLKKIPTILREAVEGMENTRFDRAHFKAYGSFSLDFETVYYVLSPDYNQYMDIQQAINLTIHERFEEEKIEFAYPTQTLFVVNQS